MSGTEKQSATIKFENDGQPSWAYKMMTWPLHWLATARRLRRAAKCLEARVAADNAVFVAESRIAWETGVLPERPRYEGAAADFHAVAQPSGFERVDPQWHMLLAFMLENTFKALRVGQDASLVSEKGLTKFLKTHSLRTLADAANVALSEQERQLFEFLEHSAVAVGRYPCASKANEVATSSSWDNASIAAKTEELYLRVGTLALHYLIPGKKRDDLTPQKLEQLIASELYGLNQKPTAS